MRPRHGATSRHPVKRSGTATLSTFLTDERNGLALRAAHRACEEPGTLSPLVLHGPSGSGKSHLLQGIAEQLGKQPGSGKGRVEIVSAESFSQQFVQSGRKQSLEAFRRRFRESGALLLDDVQHLCEKKKTQLELLHTLETLSHAGRQIVVTADQSPKRLRSLHPGLAGRLLQGLSIEVELPGATARARFAHEEATRRGLALSTAVRGIVVNELRAGFSLMLSALSKLAEAGSEASEGPLEASVEPSVLRCPDRARDLLRELLAPKAPAPPLERRIVVAVAQATGIAEEVLLSRRRRADIALARQILMHQLRDQTDWSFKKIGTYLGRSASTVAFAVDKIKALTKRDPRVRILLDRLHDGFGA
ncbi:MAG: DnaA/Hda family protein [Planctomycetota bacterium]